MKNKTNLKNGDSSIVMKKYLYFSVFISGLTSLALEMAASRLLGNTFGTSNLVWASIIGLILLYLAGGYFLGGYWADRSPHYRTFFLILILAAVSIAVVPVISRPILRLAANAFDELQLGIMFGSFTVVMILFVIPVTLLGTASPFAIRLAATDSRNLGRVSGRIYAISTIGSFIGTFLPVLVLIPLIGTYKTFLVIAAVLGLVGLIGLWLTGSRKFALVGVVIVAISTPSLLSAGFSGTDKSTPNLIYETESAYNYIQVLEMDGFRYLRLNEGQGVHSVFHPDVFYYGGPWEQVLVAPFFNEAPVNPHEIERMAIVGLAAGTTARQASRVYHNMVIDGYEIDPKIVEVGKQYFGMDLPNLNPIVQDGRWGLDHSPYKYEIISIDAYRPPYIPSHLTTQEFFQIVYDHLTDDGVMAINIGRSPDDRRLIDSLATTIRTIFPTIHVIDISDTFNTILYATVKETSRENLLANYSHVRHLSSVDPLLTQIMEITLTSLQPDPPTTQVFTDDHAPIEWITNSMVLGYLMFGDVESLE